jgi:RNA polymerase sigma-70 factor, ECF subfamily
VATSFSQIDSTRARPVNSSFLQAKSSQEAMLARARAGDPDAFLEIYSLHKRRVFSICIRMVHDFSLAEDLTQETFFQLHRKLATFRFESAFTTWLHRITVNIVLMHLRKRVLPLVSLDHAMTNIREEQVMRSFGACDLRQVGVVDRLTIDRAIAALAPGYRTVYILHDVQGLQHREIASIQGCTLGTSKSQLHKARRALRDALSAETVGREMPKHSSRRRQPPAAAQFGYFQSEQILA